MFGIAPAISKYQREAQKKKSEADVRNDISGSGVLLPAPVIASKGYDQPGRLVDSMGPEGTSNFDAKTAVDATSLMRRLVSSGRIQGIITNRPDRALKLRSARS